MEEDYYDGDSDLYDDDDDDCPSEDDDGGRIHEAALSCQVISSGSLLAAQKKDLQKVMDLLTVKEHHARTLLIHHRWNVEKITAVLVEKGKEQLFSQAGVTVTNVEPRIRSLSFSHSQLTCEICVEDVSPRKATTMECGHCFCNNCWTNHFVVKINDGCSKGIKCMAYGCNAVCDEEVVRNLVRKRCPLLANHFDRFLLESYIEDNDKVKWCPSVPHCGNAIRVDEVNACEIPEIECGCGHQFCFRCLAVTHSPCSCIMWDLWTKKCNDESETVNWITVNTKPCPKCHKSVEKNGGCNLVYCLCGQAFCWLCGGATGVNHTWTSIEGHSCGRYKEDYLNQAERAKRDLHRYMHYHDRYKAHIDSLKLEARLKESILAKISIAEKGEMKDFSWLINGLNRLFRCRRVLSYSYPFAYYMFGDLLFNEEMTNEMKEIKKNLFEDQQQQLELNIERLSKWVEQNIEDVSHEMMEDIRLNVIELSALTNKLCQKMYDYIESDLLQWTAHSIAPYDSCGVCKAVHCWLEDQSSGK